MPDDPAVTAAKRHYDADNGWHDIVPGIDVDDPEHPNPRWCNTCGRAVCAARLRYVSECADGQQHICHFPDETIAQVECDLFDTELDCGPHRVGTRMVVLRDG